MKRRDWNAVLVVVLLAGLFGFALVTYILGQNKTTEAARQIQTTAQSAPADQNANTQGTPPAADDKKSGDGKKNSVMEAMGAPQEIPGEPRHEDWKAILPRIIVRLALAAFLAAMLAFRPRKDLPLRQRNLYVAQTQILLAVVASALMMIVGDNAARAFGIFAAVSLVRFRTNIKDPKEITVLLLSLSLGLATGVGRWDLALILCAFVLPLLWLLESREERELYRAMELTVKTKDTDKMQDILRGLFLRYKLDSELRQLDQPDEDDPLGCVMYYVSLPPNVSTDRISDEVRALDPQNVDAIEWEQKKDLSSYQ
ncbi:MAG TPA: DUF4956 domain-containing protein [Pyrinomonadaceae bacterium]|jgi:uncharacterized membrane protein YhiD involved in acid resistance